VFNRYNRTGSSDGGEYRVRVEAEIPKTVDAQLIDAMADKLEAVV
jgi:hypothetical protein